jgi:hypothetical protein
MKGTWTRSIVAAGAAVMLIGAGIAVAKAHGESGHSHGHGHGGPHGAGPGTHVPGEHGQGGQHGNAGGHGNGGDACDAASSVIGAFVDTACPCAGVDDGNGGTVAWKNHGQYVRCVAHAVRDAARAAGVKRRCARALVPCAARSSCGRNGAVACVVPVSATCTAGACSNAPDMPCGTDADCATKRCAVTSQSRCDDLGGTADSGSCCTASPSGAFVVAGTDAG